MPTLSKEAQGEVGWRGERGFAELRDSELRTAGLEIKLSERESVAGIGRVEAGGLLEFRLRLV